MFHASTHGMSLCVQLSSAREELHKVASEMAAAREKHVLQLQDMHANLKDTNMRLMAAMQEGESSSQDAQQLQQKVVRFLFVS